MSVHLLRAPAKLNLYLRVLEKSADGYHEIESLAQTIDLSDYLQVEFTKEPGIMVQVIPKTESARSVDPRNNTLTRLYDVLTEEYGGMDFGLDIKLHKWIPVGGGLGGGSSDAAALLRFLKGILGITVEDALKLAFKVGSDVPALFLGGTVLVRGNGEIVEQLDPLPRYKVSLHCPDVSIDTSKAYSWLDERGTEPPPHTAMDCYEALKHGDTSLLWNDFKVVISERIPQVKRSLEEAERRYGSAFLTGSGSCVFSLSQGDHAFLPGFELI